MFVSDYLGVDSQQLYQVITSDETTDGRWIATVSQPLMKSLNLQVPYVGILKTEEFRHCPLFGINSQTATSWSYENKMYAIGSLLLHLLFNANFNSNYTGQSHFLITPKNLQLFFLLLQPLKKSGVVCVIYQEGCCVWVKQFQELNYMVMLPFEIGTYYMKAKQKQHEMLHQGKLIIIHNV
jgi:hypothetical protein